MIGKGGLLRAMIDGMLAQRKLDGDPDIIATDDVGQLRAIIAQGKRIEAYCRELGLDGLIEQARIRGDKHG